MFGKFINFLKGAIFKMTNADVGKAFNLNTTVLTENMSKAINNWRDIYEGKASWVSKYVEATKTAAQVANEFARLTTLEMETQITGSKRAEFLNDVYSNFVNDLSDKLELGNAVGGIYFKPYVNENKIYINSVEQGNFIPVSFDGDGNLTSIIFIDTFTSGENIYTRLEWNYIEKNNLVIINKAFKSTNRDSLGNEINIKDVEKWNNLEEIVIIENMEKLLGGFYRVPKANNIDKDSPLGVSVFSRGIVELKKLDIQLSRFDWEYDSAERKVYVDSMAISNPNINGANKKITVKDRLFKTLNMNGNEEFFKDYSPEIRDEAYIRGINEYKRNVEFACDLAYGTLSDPAQIERTATEIAASKQKSYAVVKKMQKNAEKALKDLIWSMDVLCTLYKLAPAGAYEVSYKWDDSLVVDAKSEREQDLRDMGAGIMRKEEYRAKWYGETEKEAIKKLPQEANLIE